MALSVWEYIRQRTADAVLAGCRDALEMLERQDQGAAMWGAAKALRQQLNEAQRGGGHTNGGHGNNSSPPSQNHSAPAQQRLPSPPAPPAPSAINRTPAPPAISAHPQNPERRKVGRPRKEVHG